MPEAKDQPEPSMEEILASIRRIISEDNDIRPNQGPSSRMAHGDEPAEDILELTEVVEDEPVAAQPPSPEPRLPPAAPPDPIADFRPEDRLLSPAPAAASRAAFSEIAKRLGEHRSRDLPIGNASLTIEDIVRQLLKPLLSEWLDDHLPGLVERLVREEIERVARQSK